LESNLQSDDDDELDEDTEDYELPPPDPTREGIDWVRDERGRISHPIKKRAAPRYISC
jgi:hypothetical protein